MTTAFDYSRMLATAKRLIARFGGSAAFVRTVTTSEPGDDPWDVPIARDVTSAYPATMVQSKWSKSEIDGERILATDKRFLVSVEGLTGFEPTTSDRLVIGGTVSVDGSTDSGYAVTGGKSYVIKNVDPLQPDLNTVLYYDVQTAS